MIWLWIALALATTLFLLRNKNIKPHNFLWAFLPIDRYGINIAGITLKPAIIYSMLLIAYAIIVKKFTIKISQSVLLSTTFLAISISVSLLLRGNDDIFVDVKTYILMFFLIICASCSVSLIESRDDLRQIKDVIIATAVGFGIVFLVLYSLDAIGITLPDVKSTSVSDNSIIKIFRTVTNGELSESIRMRGFNIDPNSSCMCFIVGLACLFGEWIKKGNAVRNIIYTLIILANVVLTSSRSALIVCVFIMIISVFRLFSSRTQSRKKVIFIGVGLIVLFIGAVLTIYDSKAFSYVYDNLISGYKDRTGLSDEYGRFTLWSEWLSLLNSTNWFCGVGLDNITQAIDMQRDAHNTIVQIFCSAGVPVGIVYTLYFLYPFYFAVKRRLIDKKNAYHLTNFTVAYIGILSMLLTILNIASLYLIYIAFLLFIIPGCLEKEEELLESAN